MKGNFSTINTSKNSIVSARQIHQFSVVSITFQGWIKLRLGPPTGFVMSNGAPGCRLLAQFGNVS